MTVCATESGTTAGAEPGAEPGTENGAGPRPEAGTETETESGRPAVPLTAAPPSYRPLACVLSADGAYAARLRAAGGDRWCPERWTLDGPEPYAVALPGHQPEDPHSQVLPLSDGRVLIVRRANGRFRPALLYPAGPGTGELPLGSVECARLVLLPPAPDGRRAYALAQDAGTTTVWLLTDGTGSVSGARGPQPVAVVPGHCTDGAWLDRDGAWLALNRRGPDGRTKAVVVNLGRGGEVTPLLEITEESNDRLLLADPDSGLLLVRSDAPGTARVGWGVLGSERPVRFPEALHPAGMTVTPFAVQPGQPLLPEGCAVALRVDGPPPADATRPAIPWLAVWRPGWRAMRYLPAPRGWLRTGRFTAAGELRLPYATEHVRCGLARLGADAVAEPPPAPARGPAPAPGAPVPGAPASAAPGAAPASGWTPPRGTSLADAVRARRAAHGHAAEERRTVRPPSADGAASVSLPLARTWSAPEGLTGERARPEPEPAYAAPPPSAAGGARPVPLRPDPSRPVPLRYAPLATAAGR
ncbi:hypothetical protein V1J52_10255 [Streptomyces sp. TRM 70351]|uniref:hypothetical protein n=1 Tax=Streptomyces sp. TRM 70351 TaxID=3116552 RepID=UPI002E7B7BE7|nr:hypothetical protein [Streptomyces sp. TRM 70351]MEE1928571.1 hypothetical protein [Streptomyces sp. TRM 70351]